MLKCVIFDWDGTLADSISKITACKHFLALKYKLARPSVETVRNVLGLPFELALSTCFPTANKEILKQMGTEFHSLMQQDEYQADLYSGVKDMLASLKEQGIMLAIATSKDRRELNKALLFHKLTDVFDISCCGKEYKEKPDPTMINSIMAKLSLHANECLMIGDTTTDVEFANRAGIPVVCVSFGAHSKERLQRLAPSALIDNWEQIHGVIEKLCQSTRLSCRL